MSERTLLPHEDEVLATMRDFGVERAWLFGSFARGEQTEQSDIDLLLELSGSHIYAQLLMLTERLEEITGRQIDATTKIKPVFLPYIQPDLIELELSERVA